MNVQSQVGDLVGVHTDTLLLGHEQPRFQRGKRVGADTIVARVPLACVTKLEVHAGRTSASTSGAIVGGLTLGVVFLVSNATYYESDEEGYGRYVLGGWLVGTAIGAGVGWLIGSAIKSDRWEEVPLDQLRVSFVPGPGGFALGFSVAF
jgi:hypothetical protein